MLLRLVTVLGPLIGLTLAGVYQERYDEALKIAKAMSLDQKIGQTMQPDF